MNANAYKARKLERKRASERAINYNSEWQNGRTKLRCIENAQRGLRLVGFADEIAREESMSRSIDHTGWYADDNQDSTYRGVVYSLPHGVLVAGYVSSDHVTGSTRPRHSNWDSHSCAQLAFDETYTDKMDAARAADHIAERCAEIEREYQEAWRAGSNYSELGEAIATAWQALRALARERGAVRREGLKGFPAICEAISANAKRYFAELESARKERRELLDSYGRTDAFKEGQR
jgi:hypothetical protein